MEHTLQTWLDPFDVDSISDRIYFETSQLERACSWFIGSADYKEWKNSRRILCLHGGSGIGKSTLMSRIKKDIKTNSSGCFLLDYFCQLSGSDAGIVNGTQTIIRTFLYQLSKLHTPVQPGLFQLQGQYPDLSKLSLEGLVEKKILTTVRSLPANPAIYVLVDGWDEMGESAQNREEQKNFLKLFLFSMARCEQVRVSCMFASRSPKLFNYPQNVTFRQITAKDTETDMQEFVNQELHGCGLCHLSDLIVDKSKGTFL